jgi:hypothetical protein
VGGAAAATGPLSWHGPSSGPLHAADEVLAIQVQRHAGTGRRPEIALGPPDGRAVELSDCRAAGGCDAIGENTRAKRRGHNELQRIVAGLQDFKLRALAGPDRT